jgi:hypothetical protein
MLEKTPDEFLGVDRHGLCLSSAGTLISKGDLTMLGRDDSAVGGGETVNVAGEIIEDGTSTLNSSFGMSDPFLLPYVSRQVNVLKSPFDTPTKALAKQSS